MTDLHALKSGTDVRGKALGENAALTCEAASRIAGAFVSWLKQRGVDIPRVALGRDSRITGEALLAASADGCRLAGARVEVYDMCTTPAMYMSLITEGFGCDGAIMITASHHPFDRNGLKFFTKEGGIDSKELDEILAIAMSDAPLNQGGEPIQRREFLPVYCEQLKERVRRGLGTDIQKPLLGLHVVVDAGNGAGGFYAQLLEDLGAWVEGSQFLEPDGHFPNHVPNPENAEAMASISAAVVKAQADLGVIFDADCDRAAIVDHTGREINRNRLIALICAILLNEKQGLTIVTDSVTSSGLARFIQEWGGEHYRFKRGYRNVIDEAIRLNEAGIDCPLAIETSGHAALRENHFLDDGMYLVTVLICEAMRLKQEGKELSSLIEELREPKESAEVRLSIAAEDFRAAGRAAIEKVMDHAAFAPGWRIAPDNREGVRIYFDLDGEMESGWFLLRLSVHDPVLPLNLESDVDGGVKYMASALLQVLSAAEGIDLTALQQFIKNGEDQ
ncbi:MAG: phosphomannomutase/phosphoglucomutase [Clostridiales bacterium]|nr:phosphomannomutase/phosphoglucomutase [Clostridiales bacterium]